MPIGSLVHRSFSTGIRQFFICPEQDSNLQTLGFKPSRSAHWRTWAKFADTGGLTPRRSHSSLRLVPDGIEPSFPGCEPSVVAVGPRDRVGKWTHRELHQQPSTADIESAERRAIVFLPPSAFILADRSADSVARRKERESNPQGFSIRNAEWPARIHFPKRRFSVIRRSE